MAICAFSSTSMSVGLDFSFWLAISLWEDIRNDLQQMIISPDDGIENWSSMKESEQNQITWNNYQRFFSIRESLKWKWHKTFMKIPIGSFLGLDWSHKERVISPLRALPFWSFFNQKKKNNLIN